MEMFYGGGKSGPLSYSYYEDGQMKGILPELLRILQSGWGYGIRF